MAGDLSLTVTYGLADMLALPVTYDPRKLTLETEGEKVLNLGGLKVGVTPRIVGSVVRQDRIMALIKIRGNLYVLVTVSMRRQRVYIINAAKYDGVLDEEFIPRQPPDHKAILRMLGVSVVKAYEKRSYEQGSWAEVSL